MGHVTKLGNENWKLVWVDVFGYNTASTFDRALPLTPGDLAIFTCNTRNNDIYPTSGWTDNHYYNNGGEIQRVMSKQATLQSQTQNFTVTGADNSCGAVLVLRPSDGPAHEYHTPYSPFMLGHSQNSNVAERGGWVPAGGFAILSIGMSLNPTVDMAGPVTNVGRYDWGSGNSSISVGIIFPREDYKLDYKYDLSSGSTGIDIFDHVISIIGLP